MGPSGVVLNELPTNLFEGGVIGVNYIGLSNYNVVYVNGTLDVTASTVVDTIAPTIICPPSLTINNTPGQSTGTTALTAPTVTDNSANALHFDGVNDYVSAALPMTAIDNITQEMWIKPAVFKSGDVNSGSQIPISYGFDDGLSFAGTNGMSVALVGSELYILYSGVQWFATGYNLPSTNQWYHIALVRANGVASIYVDGIQRGNTSTIVPKTPASFRIGSQEGIRHFTGLIDEVRIWNIARTQTQIQNNMNSELNSQPGLVANYHFNQGIANGNNAGITALFDASGIKNTGDPSCQ